MSVNSSSIHTWGQCGDVVLRLDEQYGRLGCWLEIKRHHMFQFLPQGRFLYQDYGFNNSWQVSSFTYVHISNIDYNYRFIEK